MQECDRGGQNFFPRTRKKKTEITKRFWPKNTEAMKVDFRNCETFYGTK